MEKGSFKTPATPSVFTLILALVLTGLLPAHAGAITWADKSAGEMHTIAIGTDGSLWAWGDNTWGQLGDGTETGRTHPVQIGIDTNWASVSAGGYHSIALRTDGSLWAWGSNYWGQVGDGFGGQGDFHTRPIQIGTETDWVYVSAGGYHNMAIRADGSLWAWGSNYWAQLGDGAGRWGNFRDSPVHIEEGTTWASVSSGGRHTAAVDTDGSLWIWGDNAWGQLGDSTRTSSPLPIRIGAGANWSAVSSGNYHSMAIRADGSLWAWGSNYWGQLGDGTGRWGRFSNRPVQIGTETNWRAISAGGRHSIAITEDGSLWAWGNNYWGQLGDGAGRQGNSRAYPVHIGNDTNAVSTGGFHNMAIMADGSLWAWGSNYWGQVGDGTGGWGSFHYNPVQVRPLDGEMQVVGR